MLYGWDVSGAVRARARRELRAGSGCQVTQSGNGPENGVCVFVGRVDSSSGSSYVAHVGFDLTEEAPVVTYATCTCKNGRERGRARCWHVAVTIAVSARRLTS